MYRMVKFHNSALERKPGEFDVHLFSPYYNIPLCELMGDDSMDVCQICPDNTKNSKYMNSLFYHSIYPSGTCFTVSVTTAFTVSCMVD